MVSGTSASSGTSGSAYEALVPAAPSTEALANKDTFLKLLISQIKNQDPMNPTDGVQFLTQLTSFSQLEQTMQIRQGIEGLRSDFSTALSGTDTSSEK